MYMYMYIYICICTCMPVYVYICIPVSNNHYCDVDTHRVPCQIVMCAVRSSACRMQLAGDKDYWKQ